MGYSSGLYQKQKTSAAVIYLPKLNELYYPDENGAFLNDKPIFVNKLDIKKGLYTVDGPGKLLGYVKMREASPHSRDFYCASVNFAWVASGKLSATNFVWDTLWDYIPGQYIVEKAGGLIYNDTKMHIAANNEEFLQIMKKILQLTQMKK